MAIRPAQIKMLHAEARKRGVSHEDLRTLASGLAALRGQPVPESFSLKDLDQAGLDQLLNQIGVPLRPRKRTRERGPRRAKGTLRSATPKQRAYLIDLYETLANSGWSVIQLIRYLQHHQIAPDGDLQLTLVPSVRGTIQNGVFSTAAARAAITQFEQLVAKTKPKEATDVGGGGPCSPN